MLAIYQQGDDPYPSDEIVLHSADAADSMGLNTIEKLVKTEPDIVLLIHELVYCGTWAKRIRGLGYAGPIVGYFPIYGPVISLRERLALRLIENRVSFTKYGAEVVASHGFPCGYQHLGVDHDKFRPVLHQERKKIREYLGWAEKFVAVYVARNRWNKQQPKLLKAAEILGKEGEEDILFYLHCVPSHSQFHWIPGMGMVDQEWDLNLMRSELGVERYIQFPTELDNQATGIAEPVMIERLQAADCAVHVAHGEGFGLPIVEAMACGLPLICTDDGRAMTELIGRAGMLLGSKEQLVDSTGNRFTDIQPEAWARALLEIRSRLEDPTVRKDMRDMAKQRSLAFQWAKTASSLTRLMREATEPGGTGWQRG